ncbi:unnamed protein product [Cyprideis torosa]|uniref:Uncharacterized protein n=1 Tax=Cyprideis torosa TaxID=163714 RepID=A0A7R8WSF3_9CRUS|nr:unnamed protein product [Cyprideis torosa]CAG0909379.1 unnamed protein product [Cyprideis torosa]
MNEHPDAPTLGPLKELQETRNAIIEFHAATCAVMEDVGKVSVLVTRHGKVDIEASVN